LSWQAFSLQFYVILCAKLVEITFFLTILAILGRERDHPIQILFIFARATMSFAQAVLAINEIN